MSYNFLKKALNIKSPSETENPNPEYVPPGCEPKSRDSCCVSTDWTDYITITHRLSCALFSIIGATCEIHALKTYCKICNFDFMVNKAMAEPERVNVVIKIPYERFLFFVNSKEYARFVKAIINYMPKKPEPEKPKPYSSKIVCVSGKEGVFTRGKVYTVKDGTLLSDDGLKHPFVTLPYESVQDINERLEAEFIELIE